MGRARLNGRLLGGVAPGGSLGEGTTNCIRGRIPVGSVIHFRAYDSCVSRLAGTRVDIGQIRGACTYRGHFYPVYA